MSFNGLPREALPWSWEPHVREWKGMRTGAADAFKTASAGGLGEGNSQGLQRSGRMIAFLTVVCAERDHLINVPECFELRRDHLLGISKLIHRPFGGDFFPTPGLSIHVFEVIDGKKLEERQ
jgi:hypothetical protein